MLPVQALNKNKLIVSLVLTLKSTVTDWKLLQGTSDCGCTNPAVLELEDDRLFMITSCDSGHYKVYESTNKGGTTGKKLSTHCQACGEQTKNAEAPGSEAVL